MAYHCDQSTYFPAIDLFRPVTICHRNRRAAIAPDRKFSVRGQSVAARNRKFIPIWRMWLIMRYMIGKDRADRFLF